MDRDEAIRKLIKDSYEDPRVVARYTEIGLWPAEEILVLDHVPDGARVLDIGCGGGRTAIALAEMGLDVTGIDLSEAMVRLARQQADMARVEALFEAVDVTRMSFADASFDVALYAYNGIELLPGRGGKEEALRQIARVLKPGGVLIFSVHSPFALNSLALFRLRVFAKFCFGRLSGWPVREKELGERFIDEEWEEAKYLQILPPSNWKRMLEAAGFEVVLFNSLKRIEKLKPWRFWGHFEDQERFFVARRSGMNPQGEE